MIDLNQSPYNDDHSETSKFLRVLFRPGYSIQGRELTTLQSILQTQIERFGSGIYQDGSKVTGGNLSVNKVYALKLTASSLTSTVTKSFLAGTTLKNSLGVQAKVLTISETPDITDTDRIIFINYTTSGTFSASDVLGVVDQNVSVTVDSSSNYHQKAFIASLGSGVFYTHGFFAYAEDQSILVDLSWTPSYTIGLSVSDYIVTESEDYSLLDPANGSENYNAPGAHRYAMDLELTVRPYSSVNESDANFITLLKLDSGEIASEVVSAKYSELEVDLARRTNDESGSYTVKAFNLSFEDNVDDSTKLNAILEAGKAYVEGYELETVSKTTLSIDKARDTESYNNMASYMTYGQYYICSAIAGGVFNVGTLESVSLKNSAGTQIGTARVKAVYPNGSYYNVFLTGITCTDSDLVRSITTTSGVVATIYTAGGTTDLLNGTTSNLLLSFYPDNPKAGSITDTSYRTQRKFTGILDSNKTVTLSTTSAVERFVGSGTYTGSDSIIATNYIFVVDGTKVVPTSVSIPSVGSSEVGRLVATFSSGSTVSVLASIDISSSTAKTKVKKTATETLTVGTSWVALAHSDVITSSIEVTSSGVTVTSNYSFDSGQRDEYYDYGRIRLTSGTSSSVSVTYSYYDHSGVGYFSVDSYVGVDYADIPSYTSGTTTYDLKSCFDFRSSIVGSVSSQIPCNNTPVTFDYEYYVPRYDLIVATKNKELSVVKGTPALSPKVPDTPSGSMVLHIVRMSPYTLTKNDLAVKFVENKRYTMRDIGKLEKRIENLEYYTALSLLETKTSTVSVSGKFQNGFQTDSFDTTDVADMTHYEYDCFIDTSGAMCYPPFVPSYLEVDVTTLPSDVIKTNDNVLIRSYTEESIIEQKVITGFINVNPFNVFNWTGHMILSPSVDNWVETTRLPDIVNTITTNTVPAGFTPTTTVVSSKIVYSVWLNNAHDGTAYSAATRNALMAKFCASTGIPSVGSYRAGLRDGTNDAWGQHGQATVSSQTVTTTYVSETVTTASSVDSTLSSTTIPYIRAKDVTVTCEGLLPNTRYYFSFDGVDVNSYVKPTDTGTYGAAIKSTAAGKVTAILSIPGGKFKTGERTLRISDNILQDTSAENSHAVATYTASGLSETKQRTVVLNKIIQVAESTTTRLVVSFDWTDPLAESFQVDSTTYPNGIFISSIDLYFVAKDASIPVTVQLRPTVNGYPSSSSVYGYASKTLYPDSVIVNDVNNTSLKGYADSSFVATNFKFDTPVYLEAGEHCFVVMANSDNYKVAYATIGDNVYNSSTVMTSNPYTGVMFKSQNASTWTADQYSDLCFKINRCEFVAGISDDIVFSVNMTDTDAVEFDSLNFETAITSFDDTSYTFSYSALDESTSVAESKTLSINTNTLMGSRKLVTNTGDITITGSLTSTNLLSPYLTLDDTGIIVVTEWINNDSTSEDVPYQGQAYARYIASKVTLTDDFVATDIKIWMDTYLPSASSLEVYLKYQNTTSDSSTFDDISWQYVPFVTSTASSSSEFVEYEYALSIPSGFNVYQVKVVMLTSDTTQIPSFTNFRAVTFQE